MKKETGKRLALVILMLALSPATQALGQSQKNDPLKQQRERLLKSLDGNSYVIAETRYGISYRKDFDDLRQVTLHSPKNELGNKWFWMIYPLANIDNLWDADIELFGERASAGKNKAAPGVTLKQVTSYVVGEQKCVYMLMPQYTVINGLSGRRPGQGQYDFGNYLKIAEYRVHKDRISGFENFVANNLVPAANQFLPARKTAKLDRLPRFIRFVRIEGNMSKEPELLEFIKTQLVPAAKKARADMFVYHTIYGSGSNYLLLFPYESEADLPGTGARVVSNLLEKTHDYIKALQLDSKFSKYFLGVEEVIVRTRPELSPGLRNKYSTARRR